MDGGSGYARGGDVDVERGGSSAISPTAATNDGGGPSPSSPPSIPSTARGDCATTTAEASISPPSISSSRSFLRQACDAYGPIPPSLDADAGGTIDGGLGGGVEGTAKDPRDDAQSAANNSNDNIEQIEDEVGPPPPPLLSGLSPPRPPPPPLLSGLSRYLAAAGGDRRLMAEKLKDGTPPTSSSTITRGAAAMIEEQACGGEDDIDEGEGRPGRSTNDSSAVEDSSMGGLSGVGTVDTGAAAATAVSGVSGASSTPSVERASWSTEPVFYPALEARLVVDEESSDEESGAERGRGTVYDAEPLLPAPFWRRRARAIICCVVVASAALTASIVAGVLATAPPGETVVVPAPPPTPPPTEAYLFGSCARYLGHLLDEDDAEECNDCSPPIALHGSVAVTAIANRAIYFYDLNEAEAGEQLLLRGKNSSIYAIDIPYSVGAGSHSGLSLSDGVLVAGTLGENNYTGAVYVYEKRRWVASALTSESADEWVKAQRIAVDDLEEDSRFGRYVSVDGDVLVVGSYDYQGSVYAFRRKRESDGSTTTAGHLPPFELEQKIVPNRPLSADFGGVVKVSGNRVAVGDRLYRKSPDGAVFLYEYDSASRTWNGTDLILNHDCGGRFGVHLILSSGGSGDNLYVGCPQPQSPDPGAIYHYSRRKSSEQDEGTRSSEYVLQQKLVASDGAQGNRLGQTQQIGVDGDLMAVGEYKNSGGKVYVFAHNGSAWTEVAQLSAPSTSSGRFFGDQVSLSGSRVVVATSNNAYAYDLGGCRIKKSAIDDSVDASNDGSAATNAASLEPSSPPVCDLVEVSVHFVFDDYSGETSWEIRTIDADGNAGNVIKTIAYDYGEKTHMETMCLEEGLYLFTVFDVAGDGMCCEEHGRQGYYNLTSNGMLIARGDSFGRNETKLLDLSYPETLPGHEGGAVTTPTHLSPSSAPGCIQVEANFVFDDYSGETSWEIRSVDVVGNAGDVIMTEGYEYGEKMRSKSQCLEEGSYQFTVFDLAGDGMCCEEHGRQGSYNLTSNGMLIVRGDRFGRNETTTFKLPYQETPSSNALPEGPSSSTSEIEIDEPTAVDESKPTSAPIVTIPLFPTLLTVQGLVWLDENGNGLYETTEPLLKSVVVSLRKCNKQFSEGFTVSDESGQFRFFGVEEGEYYLAFSKTAAQFDFTMPNVGGASDGSALNSNVVSADESSGSSDCFVVSPGFNSLINAGYVQKSLSESV